MTSEFWLEFNWKGNNYVTTLKKQWHDSLSTFLSNFQNLNSEWKKEETAEIRSIFILWSGKVYVLRFYLLLTKVFCYSHVFLVIPHLWCDLQSPRQKVLFTSLNDKTMPSLALHLKYQIWNEILFQYLVWLWHTYTLQHELKLTWSKYKMADLKQNIFLCIITFKVLLITWYKT